jgi:Chlorophyll A-B binding protein
MLAVVGWPIAELLDRPIAESLGLPALLTKSGESPSVLNGGLEKIDLAYWAAIFSLAGIIEIENMKMKEEKGKNYIPGDCNFDPLKLFPQERMAKFDMQLKEIKNGRVAMMAILGFVAQEALYGVPVVQETPVFFTPAF